MLEEELLELLEYDLLEQLEFDELELELELDIKPMLESDELLELELELEQLVSSGGMKGVVRSAPQPCNIRVDNKKNANALSDFG